MGVTNNAQATTRSADENGNVAMFNIAKPSVITMAQQRIGNFVTALGKRAGIKVSTDAEEMERVLGEYLPEEVRADIEMLDEVEKGNSYLTHENQVQYSTTTYEGRNSSAKISINNSNRANIKGKLVYVSEKLNKGIAITANDFLVLIQEAFGNIGISNSNYAFVNSNGVNHSLRVSNHHSKAKNYIEKKHKKNNTSVVIKLGDGNFRPDGRVALQELIYEPDNLTNEKMQGIVKGLMDWVETGEYTDKNFDDKNISPRPSALEAMTKDSKIKNHIQFFKTSNGEVYGFVKDGKMYLDPRLMNPNTPIH